MFPDLMTSNREATGDPLTGRPVRHLVGVIANEKRIEALEAFLQFTVCRVMADYRVWRRDHCDKDSRIGVELCEELNISSISEDPS